MFYLDLLKHVVAKVDDVYKSMITKFGVKCETWLLAMSESIFI